MRALARADSMVGCPQDDCALEFDRAGDLAGHLYRAHAQDADRSLVRARTLFAVKKKAGDALAPAVQVEAEAPVRLPSPVSPSFTERGGARSGGRAGSPPIRVNPAPGSPSIAPASSPPDTIASRWTCGNCGTRGHSRRWCPQPSTGAPTRCGYCHRTDGTHSRRCRRNSGAVSSVPTGASVFGSPLVPGQVILPGPATLPALLARLEAEIAVRQDAIAAVRRVLELCW